MKQRIAKPQVIAAGTTMHFRWFPPSPIRLEDVRVIELNGEREMNEASHDLHIDVVQIGNILLGRWSRRVPVCDISTAISINVTNYGKTPRTCTVDVSGTEL